MDKVTEYLNNLLIKHRVSLKMVYDCSVNQKETIDGIARIFDSEAYNDYLLSMTVLRILAGNDTDKINGYFKHDYGIDYDLNDKFFEEHKILVLTALMLNPSFYSMAMNMHGLISYELYKQESPVAAAAGKFNDLKEKVITFISKETYIPFNAPVFGLVYQSAGTSGNQLIEIMRKENIDLNGIKGSLIVNANEKNNVIQFQFEFAESHRFVPFYLEVTYVTEADNKTRKIKINEKHSGRISSRKKKNIDFTRDITVTKIRGIKID